MKENWVNDKTRILSSNWLPCLRYIFACLWSPSLCKLLWWLLIWFCSHNNIEIPTSQNKKCGFCQFITKSACFVCWNTFKSFIWEIHLQRAKIVQVKCFSSAVVPLLWLSTEAVAFFHAPRPLPFFPPACSLVSCLVSCNNWETLSALLLKTSKTEKSWIWSTGLSTQLTPSSRREAQVRGNQTALTERTPLATRWTRGTDGVSCV